MIGDFHFLRPEWLLAIAAAGLLAWIVARRTDMRSRWAASIAAPLLDHLVIGRRERFRLSPVHLTVASLAIGGMAAAGPTWERERAPFVDDRAPLVIAVDLSQTMDATDVAPTRLERAKLKVRDLLALRQGARTAIFAYAGSAHMVLPLTDDADLVMSYVDALATRIMPVPGKDTAKAVNAAAASLADEPVPGTILLMTDEIEPRAASALAHRTDKAGLVVLGIGTAAGGPVGTGEGEFLTDAAGQRVVARLDVDALEKLGGEAGIPVATVTADDGDVRWVERRIRTHFEQRQEEGETRWRDMGWFLTIPIALLSALWFRRGWTIRWAGVVLACVLAGALRPAPALAGDWNALDPWLTRDQQGMRTYEGGDFAAASALFESPMWKGAALYRAGQFSEAIEAFAAIDTAESYFDQGNAQAQLGRFGEAAASYGQALKRRPDWQQAKDNLSLIQKLIAEKKKDDDDEQQAQDPNEPPDQVQFDEKGEHGKEGTVDVAKQTAEMWMRNIQVSPADLLARKFAIEAKAGSL
jgi:Ca-activated chloride channel family protein